MYKREQQRLQFHFPGLCAVQETKDNGRPPDVKCWWEGEGKDEVGGEGERTVRKERGTEYGRGEAREGAERAERGNEGTADSLAREQIERKRGEESRRTGG